MKNGLIDACSTTYCCPLLPITALICHDLLSHRLPHTATDWPKWFPRALLCDAKRDTNSQIFPVGRISRAKTFWMERINRFCDKNAPKVRKYLRRHKCAKSAYIAFLYTWHTWRETFQTVRKLSRQSRNFID